MATLGNVSQYLLTSALFKSVRFIESQESEISMDHSVFAGKVALVMGGTAGIGKAAALLFAQAGANVVIAGRSLDKGKQTEQELEGAGGSVLYVQTDVSKPSQVAACIETTVKRFGRIDCAFNNAAVLSKAGRTGDFTEADFDLEVSVNLKSVWLCMKAELQQMEKQENPGGAIVNTSSVNGLGGARGAALYSMSKAGILALTKSAAQEYASAGVRINALVAGGFDTDLLRAAVSQMVGGDPDKIQATLAAFAGQLALGRVGRPEEAAHAAVWLCSDAASYVTGQSMIVDGGLTAWAR
jgi:NAD(P)-dependent dehydrogenase (short-subunit alcohol dehydrogenase family)